MASDPDKIKLTTRRDRANMSWVPVTRGVHRRAGLEDPHGAELRAWQEVLPPSGRMTHLTAASVRGWWLPPLFDDLPVFAAVTGSSRPQRQGLVVSRHRRLPTPEIIDGLRIDPVAQTLLACARHLDPLDLTVLMDSALRSGSCTRADVAVVAGSGLKGSARLTTALAWSDPRAESAWEVLLRVLHRTCGIEVEPQHVVTDDAGGFLARGDLWLVGTRMLHEYDGGDHLERARQRRDLRRARCLGNGDWERRGYTSEDVLHQAVSILRDADRTLGRPHDPSRIRSWHEVLRTSMFTPAGTALVRDRIGLGSSGDLGA